MVPPAQKIYLLSSLIALCCVLHGYFAMSSQHSELRECSERASSTRLVQAHNTAVQVTRHEETEAHSNSRRNRAFSWRAGRQQQRQAGAEAEALPNRRRNRAASQRARRQQHHQRYRHNAQQRRIMCSTPLHETPGIAWPQHQLGSRDECDLCFGLLWKGVYCILDSTY